VQRARSHTHTRVCVWAQPVGGVYGPRPLACRRCHVTSRYVRRRRQQRCCSFVFNATDDFRRFPISTRCLNPPRPVPFFLNQWVVYSNVAYSKLVARRRSRQFYGLFSLSPLRRGHGECARTVRKTIISPSRAPSSLPPFLRSFRITIYFSRANKNGRKSSSVNRFWQPLETGNSRTITLYDLCEYSIR